MRKPFALSQRCKGPEWIISDCWHWFTLLCRGGAGSWAWLGGIVWSFCFFFFLLEFQVLSLSLPAIKRSWTTFHLSLLRPDLSRRFRQRRHDERGVSRAAGERLLVLGRAGTERGVRPGARRWHHRGGGRRRQHGQRPEHPGGALPRAGAGGLLLP